jgi:hypothetical protein
MTSLPGSPSLWRLLHGDAGQHPGEAVIEAPGGTIRVRAGADRVARTTMQRWDAVMIVFSMDELVLPTVGKNRHRRRHGSALTTLSKECFQALESALIAS